jgi:hypothetical protein
MYYISETEKSSNPAFMIFSASHFTMDQLSPDSNKERSFTPLPPEQTVVIKTKGMTVG